MEGKTGGGKGGMRGWGIGHDFSKIYASVKLSDKLKFYKKKTILS